MNFGKAIEFGGTPLVGYNCLYVVLLRPPVCLMSFSIVISLFFRLLVGSLLSILYVLVSCSRELALLLYSCWSMMTMAIPSSAVSTTLGVSCLSLCECPALFWIEVAVVVALGVLLSKLVTDI